MQGELAEATTSNCIKKCSSMYWNIMILHLPPPKRWWTGFWRPNSRFNLEVTEFDVSSPKSGTDFCFELLSANVPTMLFKRSSGVIFSGIVPILQEQNSGHGRNYNTLKACFNTGNVYRKHTHMGDAKDLVGTITTLNEIN